MGASLSALHSGQVRPSNIILKLGIHRKKETEATEVNMRDREQEENKIQGEENHKNCWQWQEVGSE